MRDLSDSGELFIAILDQSSVNVDYRHFKPAIDNFSGHRRVQVMFV